MGRGTSGRPTHRRDQSGRLPWPASSGVPWPAMNLDITPGPDRRGQSRHSVRASATRALEAVARNVTLGPPPVSGFRPSVLSSNRFTVQSARRSRAARKARDDRKHQPLVGRFGPAIDRPRVRFAAMGPVSNIKKQAIDRAGAGPSDMCQRDFPERRNRLLRSVTATRRHSLPQQPSPVRPLA